MAVGGAVMSEESARDFRVTSQAAETKKP